MPATHLLVLSARVLAARNEDRRKVAELGPLGAAYRDQLVYAGAFLRVFMESYVVADNFDAVAHADGVRHELAGVTDLVTKGTRVYGGAWVLDPASRHDDGLFEIVPFCGKRDWVSKAIVDLDGNPLTEERFNAVGIEHSRSFRAARIEIAFEAPADGAPLAAQIDGEQFPATPEVRVDVLPCALASDRAGLKPRQRCRWPPGQCSGAVQKDPEDPIGSRFLVGAAGIEPATSSV